MEPIQIQITGARCRAVRFIRCHQGVVGRASEGTIRYALHNLDRELINVHWDNGVRTIVFAEEIEIARPL